MCPLSSVHMSYTGFFTYYSVFPPVSLLLIHSNQVKFQGCGLSLNSACELSLNSACELCLNSACGASGGDDVGESRSKEVSRLNY